MILHRVANCPESKSNNAGRIASEKPLELPPDFADYLAQIHAQNMAHLQARMEKIRQMNTTAELNHGTMIGNSQPSMCSEPSAIFSVPNAPTGGWNTSSHEQPKLHDQPITNNGSSPRNSSGRDLFHRFNCRSQPKDSLSMCHDSNELKIHSNALGNPSWRLLDFGTRD